MVFIKIKHSKLDIGNNTTYSCNQNTFKTTNNWSKKGLVFLFLGGTFIGILLLWAIILNSLELKEFTYVSDLQNNVNDSNSIKDGEIFVCYYNLPNNGSKNNQLLPSSVHPNLCTHINIAFAQIRDKKIYLDESQYEVVKDIVNLKKANVKLKVLLSVGGAGNHDGFSEMVVNHTSRKIFIKSIKSVLRTYSLDGIDLDWEFPAVGSYQNGIGKKRERQHFSQLLREIRVEYYREKRNYLLTVAVAAPQIIVDVAYDVDQINMYVDFVNIMTYDFHYYTQFTPFTGLNSPLFARPTEELYMATLNINYTVEMYQSKGLDKNKIIVGIPTYGHTFTLVNMNNTKVGSPVSGFGKLGNSGFVNYPDICIFIKESSNDITIIEDTDAKVPYLYKKSEWVSFDNQNSVIEKVKFIRDRRLGGAMMYSLNADDYEGKCDKISGTLKFPLAITIKNALSGINNITSESETEMASIISN